jgi:hypothetical protein
MSHAARVREWLDVILRGERAATWLARCLTEVEGFAADRAHAALERVRWCLNVYDRLRALYAESADARLASLFREDGPLQTSTSCAYALCEIVLGGVITSFRQGFPEDRVVAGAGSIERYTRTHVAPAFDAFWREVGEREDADDALRVAGHVRELGVALAQLRS